MAMNMATPAPGDTRFVKGAMVHAVAGPAVDA
jgi:hypothetical protein